MSGSENTGTLTGFSTYDLSCSGEGGTVEASVEVEVYPIPDAPVNMRAAYGDGSATIGWTSPAGDDYFGFPVTSNVYISTSPNIDVEAFIESPSNIVVRGLTYSGLIYRGLTNGTPVYIVATNELDGIQTEASEEVSVTPQPVPALVERIDELNDSGLTGCADLYNVNQPCPQADRPNQDAENGRDYAALNGQLTKVGIGPAGFDFTKLDGSGDPLPNDAASWQCIRDNVTGLVWEVPTDSGLTSVENRYTWYQPDSLLNGGNPGQADGTVLCSGTACDTHAFLEALNASGLCGYDDWRLPTRREIFSLADFSRSDPAFVTAAFPFLPDYFNAFFWTSTTYSPAVGINVWVIFVSTGRITDRPKRNTSGYPPGSILAVRADATP